MVVKFAVLVRCEEREKDLKGRRHGVFLEALKARERQAQNRR